MSIVTVVRHWVAAKLGSRAGNSGEIVRAPRRSFKPRLEALEDRVTPTTIKVAVVEDGSANTSGYLALANQLNHDTLFHFSATVVTPAQVSTVAKLNAYNVVVAGGSGFSTSGGYDTYAAALHTWVLQGHAVVMTGWGSFANVTSTSATRANLNAILPIQLNTSYQFTFNSPITITPNATASPVTAGITPFVDNSILAEIPAAGLEPGAKVLATASGDGNPATVVVRQAGLGRSVYLGELFTADVSFYNTSGLRTGKADQLLEQAIAWADKAQPIVAAVDPARLRFGRG